MAKFILIYNKESEIERNTFDRLKSEMGPYIIAEHDFMEVKDLYPIQQTPALIPILDHLCGEHLLDGDIQLNYTAEAMRLYDEETEKIHNKESKRLDNLIKLEKEKAREAIRKEVRDADALGNISDSARAKLIEKGIL
jgi:hypothetical protein